MLLKLCMRTIVHVRVHLHLPFHVEKKKILCKLSKAISFGKEAHEAGFSKKDAVEKKK